MLIFLVTKDCIRNQTAMEDKQEKPVKMQQEKKELFIPRESLLTEVMESSIAVRTAYSFIAAVVSVMLALTAFQYYAMPEVFASHMDLLQRAFKNVHLVILYELVTVAMLVAVLVPAVNHKKSYPIASVAVIAITMAIVVVAAPVLRIMVDFHEIMGVAILFEQGRLFMKAVSFLFECNRDHEACHPSHTSLIYFLFAPTVVYRDAYPRSDQRNWKRVIIHVMEILALAWVGLITIHNFLQTFSRVGKHDLKTEDYYNMAYHAFLFGNMTTLIGVGYGFFHCWLNIWAEILMFADKKFYNNWLICADVFHFMRNWSYLVHTWLKEYTYKPVVKITGSTFTASLSAFVVSFVVHDYVISSILKTPMFVCVSALLQGLMLTPLLLMMRKDPSAKTMRQEVNNNEPKPSTNILFTVFYMMSNVGFAYLIATRYFYAMNCPNAPFNLMDYLFPLTASVNCKHALPETI